MINVIREAATGKWCTQKATVDPLNPLGLPSNTVRVRTIDGNVPTVAQFTSYETATLVPGTSDVYDVYKSGTSFSSLFSSSSNVTEVLGANTTGITTMTYMFQNCSALTTVSLFDTSSVTNMNSMFRGCSALTNVPLYDTALVTKMDRTFYNCYAVESGALALYTQASSQATPPTSHTYTFAWCGRDTTTGAAELAQIPSSWGGTGT